MLINKVFEVRDRATCIPVLCVKMAAGDGVISDVAKESNLLRRSGFGFDCPLILMVPLEGRMRAEYDEYKWGDRTLHNAHIYISEHFDELPTGAVVDVEYILGETKKPKESGVNR